MIEQARAAVVNLEGGRSIAAKLEEDICIALVNLRTNERSR